MQYVREMERSQGGVQLDKSRQLHFAASGANLCVSVEDLSTGWECKQPERYLEIPAAHVWSASRGGLHCAFGFRVAHVLEADEADAYRNYFSCRFVLYQHGNFARRQVLSIARNFYAVRCEQDDVDRELREPDSAEQLATDSNDTIL